MATLIQSAYIVQKDQLKENAGVFTLQPGTVTRVKLLTLKEIPDDGELTPFSIPIYVVNQDPLFSAACSIEGDEPILMRVSMDAPLTGNIAIPVYVI